MLNGIQSSSPSPGWDDSFVRFSPSVSLRRMAVNTALTNHCARKLARVARIAARQRQRPVGLRPPARQDLFSKQLAIAVRSGRSAQQKIHPKAQRTQSALEDRYNLLYEMIPFSDRILGFVNRLYQGINVHNAGTCVCWRTASTKLSMCPCTHA